MNAVNPVQSSMAADHSPSSEPSMEEILASIRRIIADDQSFSARPPDDEQLTRDAVASVRSTTEDEALHVLRPPNPEGPMAHGPNPSDVTDPADAAQDHNVHAPQFASPEGPNLVAPEIAALGSAEEELQATLASAIPPGPEEAVASHGDGAPTDALFSPAVDVSVMTAFNTLAASRLVASSDELKGLVREMIRPLLKAWVEEHLPQVVERLVVAEIERIGRGAA